MSESYRMTAAYLFFARPTPVVAETWAQQILRSVYPNLSLSAIRVRNRLVAALPSPAQIDAEMADEGYEEPEYRWSTRAVTDPTGETATLVEVYARVGPDVDEAGYAVIQYRAAPFTRRDLLAGALAGVGGGLAMGLLAMLVALFQGGPDMSVWAPLNQVASTFLGAGVMSPQFNFVVALLGSFFHFTLSAGLGVIFALIFHRLLRLTMQFGTPIIAGAIYGLGVYVVADLVLPFVAPAMAFAAKPGFVAGHMVFGMVIGLVYARLRPNLAGILIVVASFIFMGAGVIVTSLNLFMPVEASTQARAVDSLFNLMLGIATVIFLIVQAALIYSALQFGKKEGDESDGPPIHGNTNLEVIWTAVPAVVVIVLGVMSYQTFVGERTFSRDDMIVEVTGQQFQWSFYYPEQDVSTVNELTIPIDRPVQYRLKSKDVIHAFWVPQFRIKRDVMPDRITDTRATATLAGEYPVVCAELCGAGHSTMRGKLTVVSQADFEAWIKEKQSTTVDTSDPIAYGRSLFQKAGCAGCHTLPDAGAAGVVGPNLSKIGSDAANMVPGQSAADYIRTSIVNPNAFITPNCPAGACPANVMPQNFAQTLSPAELDALVTYLLNQK